MKKKALIITAIVLIIAGIGSIAYFSYLKPDPRITEELEEEFGDEFFNSFTPENKTAPETETSEDNSTITGSVLQKINQTAKQQNLSAEEMHTEEAIIEKYVPRFNALEKTAFSRLDILMASAIREYRQQKAAGTLNTAILAKKYIQAGTMLEKNVDSAFNDTLNDMKTELEQNNLPTTVIDEIQNQYDSAKAAKRSELLAKARK